MWFSISHVYVHVCTYITLYICTLLTVYKVIYTHTCTGTVCSYAACEALFSNFNLPGGSSYMCVGVPTVPQGRRQWKLWEVLLIWRPFPVRAFLGSHKTAFSFCSFVRLPLKPILGGPCVHLGPGCLCSCCDE